MGFSHAPDLGLDFQALVPGNAAVLRRPFDALPRVRVHVSDAALGILGVRRTGVQFVLDVPALRSFFNGEDRRFRFILRLVIQHKFPVRDLDGDSGVLAQLP